MHRAGWVFAILASAACFAALRGSAQAQESTYLPSCFTIPMEKPFAPNAEIWLRMQHEQGARHYVATGQTLCAY